ncbi:MAG: hypothetical protein WCI22_07720, partial [Actinomycetota bacterium]
VSPRLTAVSGTEEQWRLSVTYQRGRHAGAEQASYHLQGLDERAVCRIFGFSGTHVPRLPVRLIAEQAPLLQPYCARPIRFPKDTAGELWLESDSSSRRDVLPLVIVAVVSAVAGAALWVFGSTVSGWVGTGLHIAAVLLGLLGAWTVVSTLVLMMSLRVRNREHSPPVR